VNVHKTLWLPKAMPDQIGEERYKAEQHDNGFWWKIDSVIVGKPACSRLCLLSSFNLAS
jgi:hypothetical protein